MKVQKITPVEQLNQEIKNQKIISQRCSERINKNLDYLNDNAGPIIKHEVLDYIFPDNSSYLGNFIKSLAKDHYHYSNNKRCFPRNRFTHNSGIYYLSIAEQFLPKIWPILKPIIYTYSIKKIKHFLTPSCLLKKK